METGLVGGGGGMGGGPLISGGRTFGCRGRGGGGWVAVKGFLDMKKCALF